VPDLGDGVPDRGGVLQVAAAQARVARETVAALVDELAGQLEVGDLARLPVELGQGGLDDRVPVKPLLLSGELAHQVIGEPDGDAERAGAAGRPVQRDRGLDEVAVAVHFVARRELRIARFAGRLHGGVEVAVGLLRLLEEADGAGGEVAQRGPPAAAKLPADGLQGLVDVGVHEDGAVVAGRPGASAGGIRGTSGVGPRVRGDGEAQVVEVPGRRQLPDRERQARGDVALLPLVQETAGQPGGGLERTLRRDRRRGRPDGTAQIDAPPPKE
jgi:hypothetical protein